MQKWKIVNKHLNSFIEKERLNKCLLNNLTNIQSQWQKSFAKVWSKKCIRQKSIIYHFPDDSNLLFASKDLADIELVMNNELKRFVDCVRANKL